MCDFLECLIKCFGVTLCRIVVCILFLISVGLCLAAIFGGELFGVGSGSGDNNTQPDIDENTAYLLLGIGGGVAFLSCCMNFYCSSFKLRNGDSYELVWFFYFYNECIGLTLANQILIITPRDINNASYENPISLLVLSVSMWVM